MNIPRRKPFFHPKTLSKIIDQTIREDESEKLARDLKTHIGLPNPIIVDSGRIALRLILESSEIPKGSEIIMPGYTFGILTKSIESSGFVPKPVDIDPKTFQIDPKKVKLAITKKTKVILATHLFGEPCDIRSLVEIARKHNLIIIEDCAESIGAKSHNKLTGTFGDVAFGSFNIAKPLQGISGGVIFGKNKRILKNISKRVAVIGKTYKTPWSEVIRGLLGVFASSTPFWYLLMYAVSFKDIQSLFVKGYRKNDSDKSSHAFLPEMKNIALSPLLARMVRLNIPSLQSRLEKRRRVRETYMKLLSKDIQFSLISSRDSGSAYLIVGLIKKDPFALRRYLSLRGIDIAIKEEIADNILGSKKSVSKTVSDKCIALPVYEDLKENQITKIAKYIKAFNNT